MTKKQFDQIECHFRSEDEFLKVRNKKEIVFSVDPRVCDILNFLSFCADNPNV